MPVVTLLVVALLVVALLVVAPDRRISFAAEDSAAGPGDGRWGGAGAPAAFSFAGWRSYGVLGGEATIDPDVIDIPNMILILRHQGVAGEDEDVVPGGGGVAEERGKGADAGREQI